MIGFLKRLWDRWHNGSRKLVASYAVKVVFTDMNNREETITYFLFETTRGKRSWSSHTHGWGKNYVDQFAQKAIIWELAGVLPTDATLYDSRAPTKRQDAGHDNQPQSTDDKIIPFNPRKDK